MKPAEEAREQIDSLLMLLGNITVKWTNLSYNPQIGYRDYSLYIKDIHSRDILLHDFLGKIMNVITDTADEYRINLVMYFSRAWPLGKHHGFRYFYKTEILGARWVRKPQ